MSKPATAPSRNTSAHACDLIAIGTSNSGFNGKMVSWIVFGSSLYYIQSRVFLHPPPGLLRLEDSAHKITQFLGSPHGPLSSSFSVVGAGCVVFVAPAPVPLVVAAGLALFPVAAGFASWLLPSSHANETLLTAS
jgi:hypothetical protein